MTAQTNAERQEAYRRRRNSWPTTDAAMRLFLIELYHLGLRDGRAGRDARALDEAIQAAAESDAATRAAD